VQWLLAWVLCDVWSGMEAVNASACVLWVDVLIVGAVAQNNGLLRKDESCMLHCVTEEDKRRRPRLCSGYP